MTELVQRSTDFVRSALLEHLRFESNVEASALTQQPRGQQWRVIRVSGDMLCGFLEFGEGDDRRRSNLGRHGGSLGFDEVVDPDQRQSALSGTSQAVRRGGVPGCLLMQDLNDSNTNAAVVAACATQKPNKRLVRRVSS